MPKKYDVVAITGEYEKEGQKKLRYQNVGMVIEKEGKFYLKTIMPLAMKDDGSMINFYNLYAPKNQNTAPSPQPSGDFDDDIPFSSLGLEYFI